MKILNTYETLGSVFTIVLHIEEDILIESTVIDFSFMDSSLLQTGFKNIHTEARTT